MPTSSTLIARLTLPERAAKAAADVLGELFDPAETAISAFENPDRTWTVQLYLAVDADEAAVRGTIAAALGDAAAAALTFSAAETRDWVAESLAGLKPVAAGRFVVHGGHDRRLVPGHCIGIEIEAGLAFGTAHHGTTRGCLLALDAWLKRRRAGTAFPRVLDVGTGTGVLAIAAAKVLRRPVLASDIDRQAVRIAGENARLNGGGALVRTVAARGLTHAAISRNRPYGLVFANILLGPLQRLAAPIARVAGPGATVILSGLLPDQANAALAAYRAAGFRLQRRMLIDGWATLTLRRAGRKAGRSAA